MFQAVFYKAGEIQISDKLKLKSNTPGIVMVKIENEKVTEISVSDPNRELGKMYISLSSKIEKVGENFKSIWNEKYKSSDLTIDLPQGNYAGKSVTIKL